MAIVEVSIIPIGTDVPSISSYVTACCQVLENDPQLKHKLTPMSTIIEGDLDRIMDTVKKMHKVPFNKGIQRVVTTVTIDERIDKPLTMDSLVESVVEGIH